MDAHPTDRTLRSYGLGKLDEASAGSVDRHLEACAGCRTRVAEMSSDSFLDRVRDARKGAGSSVTGAAEGAGGDRDGKGGAAYPAGTLPPGLAGHPDYQIRKELGRGGMGVVYLAHNALMGRDEVLKVMGRQIVDRPGVPDRFLREIRAVARLRHPNIVSAYAATRFGESVVLAMEYVEGLDLAKLVKAKGPLPVAHACNFAHQAALGLQHAHEEGLVHRDIKPANLMLSRRGKKATVKMLDFGLAKVAREEKVDGGLTHEGQALGTPDFIAPEQILDAQSADIRADIYSLGGTLHYLLTGRPPFRANSLYDIYQAHISREADPLNLVRPEVPSELAALVAKMMAKDPARRFQTPGEVADALKPFFKTANPAPWLAAPDLSQAGLTHPARPASGPGPEASVAGSPWEGLIDLGDAGHAGEARPYPGPGSGRRPPRVSRPVALAASLFGLFLLGAIVVTVRDRDGRVTGRLVLPEGSTATVEVSSDQPTPPAAPGPAVEAPPAAAAAGDARQRDRALLARLARPVPMRYARETPLETVLDDVRKATAAPDGSLMPVYVDPFGLQEVEKTMTSPVVIDLEGVPLETSLRLALEGLGMDYCVRDGVVFVSDWESVDRVRAERPRSVGDGSPESAAVVAKLDALVPLRFPRETPLEEAIRSITSATRGPDGRGVPIHVDRLGLQEVEKTMASPVVIDLEGVPLRTSLEFLLGQLALTYRVEKGVLRVTSAGGEPAPPGPPAAAAGAVTAETAPGRFDAVLSAFAPGVGLSAREVGPEGWSWPALAEHFGRRNVLRTHPVSESVPFVLSAAVAVPAGKTTTLALDVSHDPNGDWQLVVKADGATLHDSVVGPGSVRNGWASVPVDLSRFAGRVVQLELWNKANNWESEAAYWGRIAVVSGAGTDGRRTPAGPPPPPRAAGETGSWRVENRGKELVQTVANHSSPARLFFGDPDWTDYDVSFFLRRNQGDGDALLSFRSTNQDEDFVEFVVPGGGEGVTRCSVRAFEGGNERQLGPAGVFNATRLRGFFVQARVRGSRIECSVSDDGGRVAGAVFDDVRHPAGRVGLGTAGASYRFMDVVVKSPDGKTLWKGLPDTPK